MKKKQHYRQNIVFKNGFWKKDGNPMKYSTMQRNKNKEVVIAEFPFCK